MDPHVAQQTSQAILTGLLGMSVVAVLWYFFGRRQAEPPVKVWVSSRAVYRQVHKVLVRDIMSKELLTLEPEDNAKRAWRMLQENRVKTLPVVRNGEVVGIIALVDFLKHLGLAWHTLPEDLTHRANIVMDQDVNTLMSKPARTVAADMPLSDLVPLLSDTGLRHLPVVNAGGKLVGIVTQSDLIAGLTHLLTQPPSE